MQQNICVYVPNHTVGKENRRTRHCIKRISGKIVSTHCSHLYGRGFMGKTLEQSSVCVWRIQGKVVNTDYSLSGGGR